MNIYNFNWVFSFVEIKTINFSLINNLKLIHLKKYSKN